MSDEREARDFLNGVQIMGTPKTVNLQGTLAGRPLEGPMEVWVAALVAALSPEQRAVFATKFENCMVQRDQQRGRIARVVADIPMPRLAG